MRYIGELHLTDALDVARKVDPEGEGLQPVDLGWDEVDQAEEMVKILREAEIAQRAAKAVEQAARQRLGELLGEGGAIRHGSTLYRFRRQWKERCIDPDGAIAFLTSEVKGDRVDLGDVVNPQYIKRTWMTEAVRDTFYARGQEEDPTVTVTPMDRAPKFLSGLQDGQVFEREEA